MKAITIKQKVVLVLCACSHAVSGASQYSSFPDTTPDVILAGQSPANQLFGGFVACGGDVNGDGYDDFALTDNRVNDCRGRAYIYFGGKDRIYQHADHVFNGETGGDIFGAYITLADLNHDKYADVIVGAPGYNDWQGRVYVYFGGPNMDEQADMVFDPGAGTNAWFGRVMDIADIDKDGYTDLVIVAPAANEGRGRAYLYYGGDPMDTIADKVFGGENPGEVFGREMDMGGDVNGDGYGDLIFGCRGWSRGRKTMIGQGGQGRAYLYYGGPNATMDTKCDRTFTGESNGDNFGSSVCLFDINTDKYADVMIGARFFHNTLNRNQGRMYLYWGGPDMDFEPDLIFDGEGESAFGGDNIDCGYLNDDEYGDILVGSYSGGPNLVGRVCLYYGAPKKSMDVICDHTFTGEGGLFGWNNSLGDINGDNLADFVVSAPYYVDKSTKMPVGRAYVYYTKPFPSGSKQLQFLQENSEDVKSSRALHEAAAEGDLDPVKSLVAEGANIDSLYDYQGVMGPLHRAVIAGHKDVVEFLLSHGARVDGTSRIDFMTPLHHAAKHGYRDIAMLLIDKGADINKKDGLSLTALHHASQNGHREAVALLIAKGADINTRDAYGDVPLHSAARAGHREIAELLIAKGADVNAENNDGQTPVNLAFQRRRRNIVGLLLANGAEVSSIHMAAYTGNLAKVKAFLEKGVDVNTKGPRGQTALHIAASEGYKQIVELLLGRGANVNAGMNLNRTAAELALNNNHNDIVELLISRGADISPLHVAISMKDEKKARSLIESGADVKKQTPSGTTPLNRAIGGGLTDIAELLIAHGADVNADYFWGWTPVHGASENGYKDMVELLIAKGANVNPRDGDDRTPLWYAQQEGHIEIVELLRKHGAKE